ncbi:MAG TPA: bifunctional nuclease domain-containing protein [Nitrososphaeraceae archaeon]|jgi:bifunctional DNase/RNase|nr:bifunctional nuclease domain-containing protein [Nitrososphaeraceae archaeon]
MNDFPTLDDDFIDVEITNIGYADSMGLEGFLVLRSVEGDEFPINAFSGEVAKHILRFRQGDKNTIPTIYNLVEEIAVLQDLLLMEIRIYLSGSVLRANLYFRGRKDNLILRNYRASDAIALASYYEVPIKVRKNLFREKIQQ